MRQQEAKALLTQVETKVAELPIFKTVDSIQHIRVVYAFYCCGMLYEFDTLEQAILKRQAILESQEPNIIQ